MERSIKEGERKKGNASGRDAIFKTNGDERKKGQRGI